MHAIEVEKLGKRYRLKREVGRTLKSTAISWLLRRTSREQFWALRDVSFSVGGGETLGIVGPNGSGKSTLLGLITRTLRPTEGAIAVKGRVSSLLELGAGFHPDLTGKENIFLNGSILGLPRRVIQERFERIVGFADLAPFIDTPVKYYSSGMFVRLGFSVAVEVDPDVLLVDEVMAVGDEAFVHKCKERMAEFRSGGKTILLVTHDLGAAERMCDRILWLDGGRLRMVGDPEEVADHYRQYVVEKEEDAFCKAERNGHPLAGKGRWGSGDVMIKTLRLLNGKGEESVLFESGETIQIKLTYRTRGRIEDPVFGVGIYNRAGTLCCGSNTELDGYSIPAINGKGVLSLALRSVPLTPGPYFIEVAVHRRDHYPYDFISWKTESFRFLVREEKGLSNVGVFNARREWGLERH